MAKKKWMGPAVKRPGALRKHYGVTGDATIPPSKLKADKARLMKKAAGDKKLTAAELRLLKQINYALTTRKY